MAVATDQGLTLSHGLARWPGALQLLGLARVRWCPAPLWRWAPTDEAPLVLGWGLRRSGRLGRALAARTGLDYVALEDGFLRSVGLPGAGGGPYALVLDDIGVHVDARQPSRLERLLNGQPVSPLPASVPALAGDCGGLDDPDLLSRAKAAMSAIVAARLSKYNDAPALSLPSTRRRRVLVIDQRRGDRSIPGALAQPASFRRMLQSARAEHPDAEILIKTHPASRGRYGAGHFGPADADRRTRLITEPWNPISLLEQVDQVYVISSQMGLEALLVGVPVSCFGMPFYAGWGLTDDRLEPGRPRRRIRLEQLFAGAYLCYSRYLDPDTGEPCALERVIEHLALQRRGFERNRGRFIGYRIPLWKRRHLRRFLRSPWNRIAFVSRVGAIGSGAGATSQCCDPGETRVLVWGMRQCNSLQQRLRRLGYPLWRVEDGFLRSVALGSDLSAPASWVIDPVGLYLDPRHLSALELLLEQRPFSATELARARALREMLVRTRLSKYNVGNRVARPRLNGAGGRPVILVPGQVPRDASLRFGCAGPSAMPGAAASAMPGSNDELLARVRRARPEAHILFKPHPDLVRGNRSSSPDPIDPANYDLLLCDVGIAACLDLADEVHCMSSLVGFDALLRGLEVHTYCRPFYAGWGLTIDHAPVDPALAQRRSRRLSIDELVAAVLLRYPRYLNPHTGELTTPEQIVRLLMLELDGLSQAEARGLLTRSSWRARWLRLSAAWVVSLCHEAGLIGRGAVRGTRRVWAGRRRTMQDAAGWATLSDADAPDAVLTCQGQAGLAGRSATRSNGRAGVPAPAATGVSMGTDREDPVRTMPRPLAPDAQAGSSQPDAGEGTVGSAPQRRG